MNIGPDWENELEEKIIRKISTEDEMYKYHKSRIPDIEVAKQFYFSSGKQLAVNLVKYLSSEGIDSRKKNILDFASGYGRVSRWFSPLFKSVTISDLRSDMINFQHREFNHNGFVSSSDPNKILKNHTQYDIVFVFSLFTHLPDSTWGDWLKSVLSLVKTGGLLVFSTHSYELWASIYPEKFGDPETWKEDFIFWHTNETEGRLTTEEYGCNIMTEHYLSKKVYTIPEVTINKHFKMGEFDMYHDIFILGKK